MLIDLHAHNLLPDMFDHHPHWGPFFVPGEGGRWNIRVGDWVLDLVTPEDLERAQSGHAPSKEAGLSGIPSDPLLRLEKMDAAGIDRMVLSLPAHLYMYWTAPEVNVDYARKVNDANAAYCATSDRLDFWAHLPLQDPMASVTELERAVTELGALGIGMGGANFGGLEVDDEAMWPVWEKACELGVPLFVHGHNQSCSWGARAAKERYELTSIVGMPYDETALFWNFICGGVLDRFPDLKIYITHGGGYVPYQLGRLEGTNEVLGDRRNKMPVREYLPNFWFDPLVHSLSMRKAIVDVIGVDRLVYGDNFGGSDGTREDLTDNLGLSPEDTEKIRSGNALSLISRTSALATP
jgi:predicted TIM-barrel fold metal-dependent hydrolase